MNVVSLTRRLRKVEASRMGGRTVQEPIGVLSNRPMREDEKAAALADWRAMVARGEASILGRVLCIFAPKLTKDEWVRLHRMEY